MPSPVYVPRRGDFVWLDFTPQSGHEQRGRRPALTLSHDNFNRSTGMVMVCPITNTNRGYPLHIAIPLTSTLTGFVMVDQVKSLDYASRNAQFIEAADSGFIEDIADLVAQCIR